MWETHEFPKPSTDESGLYTLHNTSPLKHPPSHMSRIAPEYSAPTLSLLPIPRKPEMQDGKRMYNWSVAFTTCMQLTYYDACRRFRKFSNHARDDTKDGKNGGLKLGHWSKVPAKTSKVRDGEDEEMAVSGECATGTVLVHGIFESVLIQSADAEEIPPSSSDEEAEDEERYPFAKYTVQGPTVYSYTDEEYAAHCEGVLQFPTLSSLTYHARRCRRVRLDKERNGLSL